MSTLHVIPAPGLQVPMPEVPAGAPRHLPAEGAVVNESAYWRRRLADGEVTLAPQPPPDQQAAPPAKPSKSKE